MGKAGAGSRRGGIYGERLSGLRQLIAAAKLDGLLVTCMENIRYLTGFTGSAGMVVVVPGDSYFLTDGRYTNQARGEVKGSAIMEYKAPLKEVAELVNSLSIKRLGIESDYLVYYSYKRLKGALRGPSVRSTSGLVEELRMVKDRDEVRALQGAANIVEKGLKEVMGFIRPGMSEWDVAVELEHRFKLLGSEKNSFDFIVASGKRGALPHGIATHKRIRNGEMVTIDCGARWMGYYSDCTRTFMVGKPTRRQREVYQTVLDAQRKAIDIIRPGVKAKEVDGVARNYISGKGYGKYFTHGLGHGLGLAVHEEPRVSEQGLRELKAGMVVTAEPGIYIPDWGGVRIEDMVLVTEEGPALLTSNIPSEFTVV